MEELIAFDDLMERYKELSLAEKQKENISELKELLALLHKICGDIGIEKSLTLNKEVLDLNKEGSTIDDYLEAEYVYINEVKKHLGLFVEFFADAFYE